MLADDRDAGLGFSEAWAVALTGVASPAWRDALEQTRGSWQRAYVGAPANAGEVATTMLEIAAMEIEVGTWTWPRPTRAAVAA